MAKNPERPFQPAHALAPEEEPVAIAEPVPAPEFDWRDMPEAPRNRPVFMTADPATDAAGLLCFWRTSREKRKGEKGWAIRSFWASVLTKREVEFVPYCWREAVPGTVLKATVEAEEHQRAMLVAFAARQAEAEMAEVAE